MSAWNIPPRQLPLWLGLALLLFATVLPSSPASGAERQWEWTVDAGAELAIQEVIVRSDALEWQSLGEREALNLGFSNQPVWLRVTVDPAGADRVLEVGQPLLDQPLLGQRRQGNQFLAYRG